MARRGRPISGAETEGNRCLAWPRVEDDGAPRHRDVVEPFAFGARGGVLLRLRIGDRRRMPPRAGRVVRSAAQGMPMPACGWTYCDAATQGRAGKAASS